MRMLFAYSQHVLVHTERHFDIFFGLQGFLFARNEQRKIIKIKILKKNAILPGRWGNPSWPANCTNVQEALEEVCP